MERDCRGSAKVAAATCTYGCTSGRPRSSRRSSGLCSSSWRRSRRRHLPKIGSAGKFGGRCARRSGIAEGARGGSGERRGGEEGRARGGPDHLKKKKNK